MGGVSASREGFRFSNKVKTSTKTKALFPFGFSVYPFASRACSTRSITCWTTDDQKRISAIKWAGSPLLEGEGPVSENR